MFIDYKLGGSEDYIAIKNKNFQTVSGQCVVTEFESTGRTTIHQLHVEINGLVVLESLMILVMLGKGPIPVL
ncbi:hypothetical protein PB01_09180 [Psychrobacillus glaciei]|uniref:Uncharacterized protein n=1 Tax=Psychrobacillus glaciei TaxID=2283160 RepID=A0A5J6SMP1_9BACI|nr:hypothetical protein PB01_09180 [Psychrobacillus glaciei]